ncbi:alkanesulfonate monooxygenase SsuD/methylene tetrahydromethanopterin reductase-like flavin-dependent oxidoreductase (luciferase family) [Conyzicola lurida]|uniref:Alkanesulfonate monooxygenase SsuD/methylene tetrahydromethanopterin reductase-like flavin-dependent oxidoreductase (Luciferase family) n=1 Tax=Conyzicola lurida TaxID=1172621 RepID=A0A841ALX2_9MICO|nr:LLM class flavin-dependent oxidoreductase [Conyzicola lurida]MBB5842419.1 alkanesulfonate monooxygenase SsuD/methylene tetrahydromethanopterin reductase-like flavin-dependent oxidoreductase (luciferase family) [Conyzicola lurida]
MPDYGSPLQFGTFITPSNADPQQTVALAVLSETLGYDLVTFQDHPYQASFLDTWTLMTWVAAQTSTIHIAPNVLNVPLRPAAVTARSAASLDLLSGGRFDLALGSGAFWDAIEAMGGTKLTPGQAVDALSEAIDVVRGIWAAGERAPLRLEGEHYHLRGAKRGPLPAHDIPIWLGAYKPRMLRLTGRKADGWLPSLGYLKPGEFAAGNAAIDEAALAAGRDPREIRRLANIGGRFAAVNGGFLNGPSAQWADELLPYVVDDGVGTFILASDDPATLQRFAEEVAPALREAVARERATAGTTTGTVKRASVLAARRDGIDYDAVPAGLAAVEPGDIGYAGVRNTYMRGGAPGLVLQPRDTAEVVSALAFARAQGVPLAVRSGGHGISGRSTNDGGVVIDLGALDTIEIVDEATRRVRVGPGARWMDVAAALEPHGWALSSGDYGGVGVGGLATAGGIGWLVREHGLTIDHLRRVEIVLADGSVVTASDDENADLFWAVRGAGANFGIVTSFEFEVDEVGPLGFAQLAFDASDTAAFLEGWGATVEASPRDLTSFLIMGAPRQGQMVAQTMNVVDSDDPETIVARLQPIADLAPMLQQSVQLTSYAAIMANASGEPHNGQGEPIARSGLLESITPAFAAAAQRMLATGDIHFFQIRSVGGAVSDVPADATAYAHRSANFSVAAIGRNVERMTQLWDELFEHFSGLYLSFETDLGAASLEAAFPPATIERLRVLKRRYDPQNTFRDNFNIV